MLPPGSGTITNWAFDVPYGATNATFPLTLAVDQASNGAVPIPIGASSGQLAITECFLDVDMDGGADVATDIVYIARHLLGLPPVPASFRQGDPNIPPDAVIAANIDVLCPLVTNTPSSTSTPTRTPTFTPTRTVTPLPTLPDPGPQVLFFGIANNDGCVACAAAQCDCSGVPLPTPAYDNQGRRIFERTDRRFVIVIEARPGSSAAPVCWGQGGCTGLKPADPATRPDLQIESTSPLGDGGPTVDWRTGLPEAEWGGIAAIAPPDFGPGQTITDALQDFASRFRVYSRNDPCTLDAYGNAATVTQDPALLQFCDQLSLNANATFPSGDTILTAQLRDTVQNIGPTAQIVEYVGAFVMTIHE